MKQSLTMPELFARVSAAASKEERIAILREYDNPPVRRILQVALDKAYVWDLPTGKPPYKEERDLPIGFAGATLFQEARRFYIFEKAYTNIPSTRKESIFIGMLEGLHWTDADLVIAIKDGEFKKIYKGLTEGLVREAYPGLLSENKSAKADTPV